MLFMYRRQVTDDLHKLRIPLPPLGIIFPYIFNYRDSHELLCLEPNSESEADLCWIFVLGPRYSARTAGEIPCRCIKVKMGGREAVGVAILSSCGPGSDAGRDRDQLVLRE